MVKNEKTKFFYFLIKYKSISVNILSIYDISKKHGMINKNSDERSYPEVTLKS
jgi:hypothetical protein